MSTFELMVEGIIYDLEAWSGSERGLALLCLKNFRSYFFFFSILNVVRERKEEYIATLAKVNETPSDENRN